MSDEDLEKALNFLEFTNRHIGGTSVILRKLKQYSPSWTQGTPIKILDVGSGLGDIPIAILHWAERAGHNLSLTALESNPRTVSLSMRRIKGLKNISVVCADIFDWPEEDDSYDYVTASLFLHHIGEDRVPALLKKLNRMARRGLIISDLIRSRLSYCSVRLLSLAIGNSVVRNDGPLSVRRSFTLEEFKSMAKESNLTYLKAQVESFFRLSLSGDKTLKP